MTPREAHALLASIGEHPAVLALLAKIDEGRKPDAVIVDALATLAWSLDVLDAHVIAGATYVESPGTVAAREGRPRFSDCERTRR